MKKLLILFFAVGLLPAFAQDSIADAARASKAKQGAAKKVITDEDMPSTSTASSSVGSGDWESDLSRVRAVYRDLCADPALRNAKSLPADKQKLVDDAMAPLKARMERDKLEMNNIKARLADLKRREDAEVSAAGSDQQRVNEIHERYIEQRKPDQAKVAATLQMTGEIFKQMMSTLSECIQTASAK
jgi:hypothetical protein